MLGFSDKVKEEQDLGVIENDALGQINQSLYCDDPDKQKALVLFVGDNTATFIPEVRALDVASLCSILLTSYKSVQTILYDNEVIRAATKLWSLVLRFELSAQ